MLKNIIFTLYILSFGLPFLKILQTPIIKDWSWFAVIMPFWATTCVGLIVGWVYYVLIE